MSTLPKNAVIAEMMTPFVVEADMLSYSKNTVRVDIGDGHHFSGPHDMLLSSRAGTWVDLAWNQTTLKWYFLNHAPSCNVPCGFKEANVFLVPGKTGPLFVTKRKVKAYEELTFTYAQASWPNRENTEKFHLLAKRRRA